MSNTDNNFANNMIAHHENAISMAKDHLQNGDDSGLKEHAQGIIDHGTGVVQKMHGFLAKKGAGGAKALGDRNMPSGIAQG